MSLAYKLSSMAAKATAFLLFLLNLELPCLNAQNWVEAGYWYTVNGLPISDVDSSLFTHIIFAFATVNDSTYQVSIASSDEKYFSNFTDTLKRKNPSIKTIYSIYSGLTSSLQSIAGDIPNSTVLSSMVSEPSRRNSFIESTIKTARHYGFHGIDLCWVWPNGGDDLKNIGILLDEWRAAINSEQRKANETRLILTMALHYLPTIRSTIYPIESIKKNLDWAHLVAHSYYVSPTVNFTRAHAALYDPSSQINTDFGVKQWVGKGLPANKMVLGLPYYGYAWTLVNPRDNGVGAPASGPAVTLYGYMAYKFIKSYTRTYVVVSVYNSTYVMNYCFIRVASEWIAYDDVEAIKAKVSYAREKGLLGYNVFTIGNDENWVLSWAAHVGNKDKGKIQKLLVIILVPIVVLVFLIGLATCYLRRRAFKSRGAIQMSEIGITEERHATSLCEEETDILAARNFDLSAPNLQGFSFASIEAATSKFSYENLLGKGGFGPVYIVMLGILCVRNLDCLLRRGIFLMQTIQTRLDFS